MSNYSLTIFDNEAFHLDDIFFSPANKKALKTFIKEHQYIDELKKFNLPIDNKLLLHGHTGCGKTTTAKAIAKALDKKIIILNLSTLISSRLGETAKNVKQVFDQAKSQRAVLFLDEFDQIGKMRSTDDAESGEMRRLVNAMIQQIDYFPSNCVLIGATNFLELIDAALLRRFQLKLAFELPNQEELNQYYNAKLKIYPQHLQCINRKYNISYAEAQDYIFSTLKQKIIHELENK